VFTVDVWVEPTPRLFTFITNDTICNDDPVIISFGTPTTATIGIDFNMRIINIYPEITGYSPDTERKVLTDLIDENINNSGDTARMIMYIFTPYILDGNNNQKCEGIRDTVRVWINPTPRIIPVVAEDRICSEDETSVQVTSPTLMTHGVLRFDYTVDFSPGGLVGNNDPLTIEKDDIIHFPYENTTDTVQSVYYNIIPRSVGTGCAPGLRDTSEVKVHPDPLQEIVVTNPLTCDSNLDLALEAVVAKGTEPLSSHWTGPFNWSADDVYEVEGLRGGIYRVTVTDNLGCQNLLPIEQTDSPPLFTFYSPIKDNSNPLSANTSCYDTEDAELYIWYDLGDSPPYLLQVVKVNDENEEEIVFEDELTTVHNHSDPSTYHIVPGIAAGDYELRITDVNGCPYDEFTTVVSPEPIIASYYTSNYAGYNVRCKWDDDAWISIENVSGGNGGYSYFWTDSLHNPVGADPTADSIGGLTAGTYYLDITDVMGCVMTDTIILIQPDGITPGDHDISEYEGGFNISCHGSSDGYINLVFEGGAGDYTYLWSGPAGADLQVYERNQSGLIAGDYNVVVTDINGCDLSMDFTLTEPESLGILFEPSMTSDNAYNIYCNGGTGSIDITASGGSLAGYTYSWSTPDGSGLDPDAEDQAAVTAGWYIVEVRDLNDCILTDSIELTQPPALTLDPVVTNITCASVGMDNGSIDLTVTGGYGEPYDFEWTGPGGFSVNAEDLNNLTEGWYYILVTDQYSCTLEDSAYVSLPPPLEFEKDSSNYNGYGISCYNENDGYININMTSGEAPYSYSWTGPGGFISSDSSISDLSAGEYIITVEDNNYCTVTDTTVIVQPDSLVMNLDISVSNDGAYQINCYGDSTGSIEVLYANNVGNVSFTWPYDGGGGSLRGGLPAGTYGVFMVDENGCRRDTVVELTQPEEIIVSSEVIQPYCKDMPDGEINLDVTGGIPSYTYLWHDDNTITDYRYAVPAGEYHVTVTDANSCSVTDTIVVTSERELCISIPNAISPNNDGVHDEWTLNMIELYPEAEVKIFNRWGELVWASEKGYPQKWDGTSRGRPLPIDSYHYIINLHDGTKPIIGDVTIIR
jgi:gliding motility-associated-like protein